MERRTRSIRIDVADSTNFYLRKKTEKNQLYEAMSSETFYMIDNSTGTYFEGDLFCF